MKIRWDIPRYAEIYRDTLRYSEIRWDIPRYAELGFRCHWGLIGVQPRCSLTVYHPLFCLGQGSGWRVSVTYCSTALWVTTGTFKHRPESRTNSLPESLWAVGRIVFIVHCVHCVCVFSLSRPHGGPVKFYKVWLTKTVTLWGTFVRLIPSASTPALLTLWGFRLGLCIALCDISWWIHLIDWLLAYVRVCVCPNHA